MKTTRIFYTTILGMLLIGCGHNDNPRAADDAVLSKKWGRAYVYKNPVPGDLICVFYADEQVTADYNAKVFADWHEEKAHRRLYITSTLLK